MMFVNTLIFIALLGCGALVDAQSNSAGRVGKLRLYSASKSLPCSGAGSGAEQYFAFTNQTCSSAGSVRMVSTSQRWTTDWELIPGSSSNNSYIIKPMVKPGAAIKCNGTLQAKSSDACNSSAATLANAGAEWKLTPVPGNNSTFYIVLSTQQQCTVYLSVSRTTCSVALTNTAGTGFEEWVFEERALPPSTGPASPPPSNPPSLSPSPIDIVPQPPTGVSARVLSYDSLIVTWNPPAANNGATLNGFQVQCFWNGPGYRITYGSVLVSASATSATVNGLPSGLELTCSVSALSGVISTSSASSNSILMPSPVVPLPGGPVPPPVNSYSVLISPGVTNPVTYTSIITNNNLPTIVYTTSPTATGIQELTVAPAWQPVGTNAPFTAGSVAYLDLALQGANPVFIGTNGGGCSFSYNLLGSAWTMAALFTTSCSTVGGRTVVTPPGSTAITAGSWICSAVRTAAPYAAFRYYDGTANSFGTNTATTFTTPISGMDMAVDPSGEVWVAIVNSGSASVFQTTSTGTPSSSSWALDSASTAVITNAKNNIKLIMTSTTEGYLAFQDITSNFLSVAKRTNAGWSLLGGPNISGGAITVTTGASIAMAVDALGTPYVAYAETALSDKLTIQKWTGSAWEVLGGQPGLTSGGVKALGMASSATRLYFVYGDVGNSDILTVGEIPI